MKDEIIRALSEFVYYGGSDGMVQMEGSLDEMAERVLAVLGKN